MTENNENETAPLDDFLAEYAKTNSLTIEEAASLADWVDDIKESSGVLGAYRDVFRFHEATDSPIWPNGQGVFPSQDRIDLRVSLVDEEVNKELFVAIENRDMVEVADAIADSIYVLIGMALEFGIPLTQVWDEVQRSNMAKVDPTTGKVRRRDDGKILKPEGWTPPDIAGIFTE